MNKKKDRLIHLLKDSQEQYSEEYLIFGVPNYMSKRFIAYCAMKEDFELILQYIREIRNNPTKVIQSSLSYSLIALYGKCFTDASESSFPKLESTDLFKKDDNKNSEVHNYLMELRHKFIAHRGETENEIAISYILVPKKDLDDNIQVRFSQLKMVGFSNEDLDKFEILANFIIEKLKDKIQKSGEKVRNEMLHLFKEYTREQLRLMLLNEVR